MAFTRTASRTVAFYQWAMVAATAYWAGLITDHSVIAACLFHRAVCSHSPATSGSWWLRRVEVQIMHSCEFGESESVQVLQRTLDKEPEHPIRTFPASLLGSRAQHHQRDSWSANRLRMVRDRRSPRVWAYNNSCTLSIP